ncbi:MAG: MFS transporter [Bifidobacteriaceae bacterium]|jgi:DHA3 family macrolide efflux protein-like MFS transporter|nr:MFS transporter [Bifidobacteriaceae bacterium]
MKNALDFTTNKWRANFYVFRTGQFVTKITSAVVDFALVWQVVRETSSATMLSMTQLVYMLPMILLMPFVGPLVDRMNKKFLLIAPDLVLAVLAVVLMVVGYFSNIPLELIFIMLFLRGLASAFQSPTVSSINPTIVPSDYITKAAGQTAMINYVSFLIAPAFAAAVFDILPLYVIISFDILGAIIGTLCTVIANIPSFKTKTAPHFIKDAKEGLHLLRMHKGIYYLLIYVAVWHIFEMTIGPLFPLLITDYFNGSFQQVGIAEIIWSVGTITGSFIIGARGAGKNRMIMMLVCTILFGLLSIPIAFLPQDFTGFAVYIVLMGVSGLVVTGLDVPFSAIMQSKYPPEKLGAVNGVASSITMISGPIGLALVGPVVDVIGIETVFTAVGVTTLIFALAVRFTPSVWRLDKDVPDYVNNEHQ